MNIKLDEAFENGLSLGKWLKEVKQKVVQKF
jgi:hypothetical protein